MIADALFDWAPALRLYVRVVESFIGLEAKHEIVIPSTYDGLDHVTANRDRFPYAFCPDRRVAVRAAVS